MAKEKKYKSDIFQILDRISTKDVEYFRKLSEEERKGFVPFVVMRWLTGTYSAKQIYFINELVNPVVFHFCKRRESDHTELLYYLLTLCTSGQKQRYIWNKSAGSSTPLSEAIVSQYFEISRKEAKDALPSLTDENILRYAEELGSEQPTIAKLKKELKSR